MCQVKSWIMCTSQHSQFIQVAVSSIRSIKEDYHLAFQVWIKCLKFLFSAKQQLLDKNQEVSKNVITVPNSVQNYCKTSQEPAAVLWQCQKTVNDISQLGLSLCTTWWDVLIRRWPWEEHIYILFQYLYKIEGWYGI